MESSVVFNKDIPIIIQRLKKKEPCFFFNMKTGKSAASLEKVVDLDSDYLLVNESKSKQSISLIDIKYDDFKELLVIMLLEFDITKPIIGEIREAKEVDRIIVDKNKEFFFKKTQYNWDYVKREYNVIKDTNFSHGYGYEIFYDLPFHINNYLPLSKSIFAEVRKMFPEVVTLSGNKLLELNNLTNLNLFLKYKEPIGRSGPKQKEVDKFVSIELPEITDIPNKDKFAIISRVNGLEEDFCVLRTFIKTQSGNAYEGGRIYIGKKKVICCKKSNDGKYLSTTLLSKPEHWNFSIEDFDAANSKGTKLEYFGEILKEIPVDNRGLAVWAFIKWDITEKLFKSEFKEMMMEILKNCKDINPIKYLENQFGKMFNDKNIYKSFGINKYQASKVIEDKEINLVRVYGNLSPILLTKILLAGVNYDFYNFFTHYNEDAINISDIDNDTFDATYKLVKSFSYRDYRVHMLITSMALVSKLYGIKSMLALKDKIIDLLLPKKTKTYPYYHRNLMLYRDYLTMVDKLDDALNFKPQFKDIDDIQKMHDAVMIVYNLKANESSRKKFKSHVSKWKKWEFKDENFSAIAPKDASELAKEGLELRHCVKSYIDRVADGITNIMFLRRNSELDKPFFTVEISNSGNVEQIHGFANCNLNTEPSLIPFVEKWVKEKKLKRHNINKVR